MILGKKIRVRWREKKERKDYFWYVAATARTIERDRGHHQQRNKSGREGREKEWWWLSRAEKEKKFSRNLFLKACNFFS